MNLLIDAGNSRIKWALYGVDHWSSCASERAEFGQLLDDSIADNVEINSILISSTRNQDFNQQLVALITKLFEQKPQFIKSQRRKFGVINRYESFSSLGADRWTSLVAARAMSHSSAIIIDCGTAVTIDLLSSGGVFEGGVIFPGVALALQSLNQADNLTVPGHGDVSVFARSSQQAMYSGVIYSVAGAIDRIVLEMRKKQQGSINIYLTGGDADKVAQLLDHNVIMEPDMVLKGLKIVSDAQT